MSTTISSILSRSNVHISGGGKTAIVLIHGMGCSQSLWQPLLPAFEAQYRVVRLDLVGCGESRAADYSRERHGTLAGHATDLIAVLEALKLTGVVFVGHSVGAMIGVMAAVRAPHLFAKMVLLAPSPRFLNGHDYTGGYERTDLEELLATLEADPVGWSQSFAPVVVGETNRPDLVMAFSNSFVNTNAAVMSHFARVVFFADCRDQLPLLGTPTLIVQSARDVMAPLGVGYYLHEQLPDSQIAVVDTAGHCPHLTAPEQTLAAIGRFLGRELKGPGGRLPCTGPAEPTAPTERLPGNGALVGLWPLLPLAAYHPAANARLTAAG